MLEKVPAPTMQGGMFSRLVKAGETCPIATTETYPDYLMPELPELTVEELARAESIASRHSAPARRIRSPAVLG